MKKKTSTTCPACIPLTLDTARVKPWLRRKDSPGGYGEGSLILDYGARSVTIMDNIYVHQIGDNQLAEDWEHADTRFGPWTPCSDLCAIEAVRGPARRHGASRK